MTEPSLGMYDPPLSREECESFVDFWLTHHPVELVMVADGDKKTLDRLVDDLFDTDEGLALGLRALYVLVQAKAEE